MTEVDKGRIEYTLKERRPGGDVFWAGHGVIDRTDTNDSTQRYWTYDDDVPFAYPVRNNGAFTVGDFCADAVPFTTG